MPWWGWAAGVVIAIVVGLLVWLVRSMEDAA